LQQKPPDIAVRSRIDRGGERREWVAVSGQERVFDDVAVRLRVEAVLVLLPFLVLEIVLFLFKVCSLTIGRFASRSWLRGSPAAGQASGHSHCHKETDGLYAAHSSTAQRAARHRKPVHQWAPLVKGRDEERLGGLGEEPPGT